MKPIVVKSFTKPGKTYLIRETPHGFICNCPDSVIRNNDNCKHIKAYREEGKRVAKK